MFKWVSLEELVQDVYFSLHTVVKCPKDRQSCQSTSGQRRFRVEDLLSDLWPYIILLMLYSDLEVKFWRADVFVVSD